MVLLVVDNAIYCDSAFAIIIILLVSYILEKEGIDDNAGSDF